MVFYNNHTQYFFFNIAVHCICNSTIMIHLSSCWCVRHSVWCVDCDGWCINLTWVNAWQLRCELTIFSGLNPINHLSSTWKHLSDETPCKHTISCSTETCNQTACVPPEFIFPSSHLLHSVHGSLNVDLWVKHHIFFLLWCYELSCIYWLFLAVLAFQDTCYFQ